MLLRLQNSVASMNQMVRQQERVANNLANVNTVGYKRDRMFTEALNEHLDNEGAPQSDRRTTQWSDAMQGPLDATGNPLDVALTGEGFFAVTDEGTGATHYTRAGQFVADAEGLLRTPAGHLVEGEEGPIQLPLTGGAIEIDETGAIEVGGQPIGKLRVVTFENLAALQRLDASTFDAGDVEPEPVEAPAVKQGFVEGSNVDAMQEMTDMIAFFRQFESHQKMLQTSDQILGSAARELGKF